MNEVIGDVQVVVRPDTTGFAEKARDGIERQFKRKNALELDFEVDPDSVRRDVEDARDLAQKWLDLKKNALKVQVDLKWNKSDLFRQLRDFKSDVEALEKLNRPTVKANFEVDRRGLEAIKEDVKLNVSIDTRTLQRSIQRATKDVTVFGDQKALREKTEKAAGMSSRIFQDVYKKQQLRIEIDADTEKLEKAQQAMESAFGVMLHHRGGLESLEKSLSDINKQVEKQSKYVANLADEWDDIKKGSVETSRSWADHVNELQDAETALKRMVRQQEKLRLRRDHKAHNMLDPSIEGAKRLQREFEQLERQLDDKEVEFSAVVDRTSFAAVAAEIAYTARDRLVTFWGRFQKVNLALMERNMRSISGHTKNAGRNAAKWLTQLAGVRVLWRTFVDMVDWLPRLDMMVPKLASSLALITAATAGAIGGVGVLFTLLSDIGEVGKLLLGLPAVLTGVVGSALIVGRAIVDFKNVFPEIISYYKQLGNIVSSRVWKEAAGPVRELHKALVPILDRNIPAWSTAWGKSMGALAKGLGSKSGLAALDAFLTNSIAGTKNAEKGWTSLGSALMGIIGAGSGTFPDLGTWFSETMADFDTWVQGNGGNIERWVREGATALRELGSIGVSTVKIVAGIADAFQAAGWPGLTELERGMKSLGESALVLKDNDLFMQPLEQVRYFFTEMKTLGPKAKTALSNAWLMIGDTIEELAGPITGALGAILDGFNSPKFQTGFGKFVTGISSFIRDVTPGLEAMTAEIGSLLGVVGTAAKSWGPAFNETLLMFSSAGDNLHPGVISFIENTGPALLKLVEDLTPKVEEFATALSDLLGNPNFQEFANDMIGTFGTILGAGLSLGTWLIGLIGKFSDWYASLGEGGQAVVRWGGIIGGALGIAGAVIGGFALKLMGWLTTFKTFFGWFKNTKLAANLGKLFAPIRGLGAAIGRWLAPLKSLPGTIGRLAGRFLTSGGLMKIIRPIFTRFIGILNGPVGWIAIIMSIIRPIDIASLADWIVDALGLENTFIGRLTESLKTKISEMFGGKSLLGIILDNFGSAFGKFADGDILGGIVDLVKGIVTPFNFIQVAADAVLEAFGFKSEDIEAGNAKISAAWEEGGIGGVFDLFWSNLKPLLESGWDTLVDNIKGWGPVKAVIEFFDDPWGKIKEWLGLDKSGLTGEGTAASMRTTEVGWGKRFWDNKIKPWLQDGWDNLVSWVKGWKPVAVVIEFFQDPWGKIKEWLGIPDNISIGTIIEWGTSVWNESIKPWLQGGWDKLKGFIMDWTPAGLAIKLGTKIGEWVRDALGLNDTAGASFDFDFSKYWPGIRTALTRGLMVLVGLIAAPGLVLIAPLAIPALIAGWLLGRDGEGNWSFGEIQSKIEGAWGKIKEAIGSALGTIGGLIGGLVFTPLITGAKIAEWIVDKGGGFLEDTKTAVGNAIGAASSAVGDGVERGKSIIKGVVGGGEDKGGNGFMRTILGVGAAGIANLRTGFGLAGGQVSMFGGFAKGELTALKNTGNSETGALSKGVVGAMGRMRSGGTGEVGKLKSGVIGDLTATKSGASREAADMQRKYVAEVVNMQRRAVQEAGRIRQMLPSILRVNTSGAGNYTGGTFVSGLASGLSRAVGVAQRMAGGIRRALSFSVYSSGSSVGGTFASGISSRVGAVAAAANRLAAAARARMPNSPADAGPFSGSGWGGWGESIAEELARGMRLGAPAVALEASRMMSSAAAELSKTPQVEFMPDMRSVRSALTPIEGSIHPAGMGAGTTVNVNVESRSEDPLQDGNRFGGDIAFALRGAGLA